MWEFGQWHGQLHQRHRGNLSEVRAVDSRLDEEKDILLVKNLKPPSDRMSIDWKQDRPIFADERRATLAK
jgi:hypothetical protein